MRPSLFAATVAAVAVGVLAPVMPASAAGPAGKTAPPDKAAVLKRWTQPSAGSYRQWNVARLHPRRWAAYGFVWTHDNCTLGPDRPAGFDFRAACRRHDFGYRNYLVTGRLAANRGRLDRALHADLRRQCQTYRPLVRPVCSALAWTYFQAARKFGVHVVRLGIGDGTMIGR
ncbi:MAG TPA: phospholipase [Actinoplanes sp.]